MSNVVYACIRMGNSVRPVDNINAGGMYSPIDLETGKIACAACDKQRIVYERHPRSRCLLKGYQIPYWDKVMDICREAAHKVPQMGYIGWDVAITKDGPLFIEANNMPGHDAFHRCRCRHRIRSAFCRCSKNISRVCDDRGGFCLFREGGKAAAELAQGACGDR